MEFVTHAYNTITEETQRTRTALIFARTVSSCGEEYSCLLTIEVQILK